MKQSVILFLSLLLFFSCKKDKDNPNNANEDTANETEFDPLANCDTVSTSFLNVNNKKTPLYYINSKGYSNEYNTKNQVFIEASNYNPEAIECLDFFKNSTSEASAVLISLLESDFSRSSKKIEVTNANVSDTKGQLKIVLPGNIAVIAVSGTIGIENLSYQVNSNKDGVEKIKKAKVSFDVIGDDGNKYSGVIEITEQDSAELEYYDDINYTFIDYENKLLIDENILEIDSVTMISEGFNPDTKLVRHLIKMHYIDANGDQEYLQVKVVNNRIDYKINGTYTTDNKDVFYIEEVTFLNSKTSIKSGSLLIENLEYSSDNPKLTFSFVTTDEKTISGYFYKYVDAGSKKNYAYYNSFYYSDYFDSTFTLHSIYAGESDYVKDGVYKNKIVFAPQTMIGLSGSTPWGNGANIYLEVYSTEERGLPEGTYNVDINSNSTEEFTIKSVIVYYGYKLNFASISSKMIDGKMTVGKDENGEIIIEFDFHEGMDGLGYKAIGTMEGPIWLSRDY